MSLRCRLFGHAKDPMRTTLADGRPGFACRRCGATWPVLERDTPAFRPEAARAQAQARAVREQEAAEARKDQQLADVLDELRRKAKAKDVTPFRRRA